MMRFVMLLTAILLAAPVQAADLKQLAEQLVNLTVKKTQQQQQHQKQQLLQLQRKRVCRVESWLYRTLARLDAVIRHFQKQEARALQRHQLARANRMKQQIIRMRKWKNVFLVRLHRVHRVCHGDQIQAPSVRSG